MEQLGELQGMRAEMVHKPSQQPGVWHSERKGYCADKASSFAQRSNLLLPSPLHIQLYLKLAFGSRHLALQLSRLLHLDPSFWIAISVAISVAISIAI
ncbi:hypothetical protein [Paenibacillus sp. SN-8-1]|uniref:hypothetical protein n=1 Tax=Paenibacillus sp. SN-8-1 TaxID=3435409 RepID=UPI003D9A4CC6